MRSGYKLFWSEQALADLGNIIEYLTENWSQKEIRNFARRLDRRLNLIIDNPKLFPRTRKKKNVRRSVLTRQTVIYYEMADQTVTIVSLFDSRRHPGRLKL